MVDTITFNYHWVKPEISGSPTTWGVKLNADLDLLDTTLFAIDQRADSFVGEIKMYAGATAPPKWKLCDGTVYNVSDIPQLAPIIGNIYGGASGISCAVPNLQQRFPIGSQIGVLTPGTIGGEATHVITVVEMPSHTHTVVDPGHKHTIEDIYAPGHDFINVGTGSPFVQDVSEDTTINTTGITLSATGGGGAHNNMPPYVCINFIIKYML